MIAGARCHTVKVHERPPERWASDRCRSGRRRRGAVPDHLRALERRDLPPGSRGGRDPRRESPGVPHARLQAGGAARASDQRRPSRGDARVRHVRPHRARHGQRLDERARLSHAERGNAPGRDLGLRDRDGRTGVRDRDGAGHLGAQAGRGGAPAVRGRSPGGSAASSWRTAARSSWTRWASCRSTSR